MAHNPVAKKSVHGPDYKMLYPTSVRMEIPDHEDDHNEVLLPMTSLKCAPTEAQGWRPDPSVPGTRGIEGEISVLEALNLFGVETGDDPNCLRSNDDFVIIKEQFGFDLLRCAREGFAKVFVWKSRLSSFEWKLKCEYASSKTGAWQQPIYSLQNIHSPEAQVGLALAIGGEQEDEVVVGKLHAGCAAVLCGAVRIGDVLVAINGTSIIAAVEAAEIAAKRPLTTMRAGLESSSSSFASTWTRTNANPLTQTSAARRCKTRGSDDGRHPIAKAALLRARATLLGLQGSFTWLTFQRQSLSPPEINSNYLPTFAPHIHSLTALDSSLVVPLEDSVWQYQVRLLKGDANYISAILALDWKVDQEDQQHAAFDRVNRKMFIEKLLRASAAGNDAEVDKLLACGTDPNGTNDAAMTPLHFAAFHGHNSIVAALVAARADVNAGDCFQASALHKAARRGHAEVVQTLLDFGADNNHVDIWEASAIHWATVEEHMSIVESLAASGTDVGQKNTDGHTATQLSKTHMFKGYRYAEPLVTAGKDTTNVPRTPIAASREQHEEYEENDEEGKEEEEREKGRERERIREQRAEMEGQQKQNNERESEAEREKQIQRNLLAAAGMSL